VARAFFVWARLKRTTDNSRHGAVGGPSLAEHLIPENDSGSSKVAIKHVDWPTQQVHAGSSETERGPQRLMSVGAAADYLGISRATVERLVQRGDLPIVKIGRATRYDIDDLDRYVENNRAGIASARPKSVTLRDLIEREGEGL